MAKSIKSKCARCESNVLLFPVGLAFVQNEEVIFVDDTYKYDCPTCENRVVYKTKEFEMRERTFEPIFKESIHARYGQLSKGSMKLFFMMAEHMDGYTYFCVNKDKKAITVENLMEFADVSESEIDLLIAELWKARLIMQIKFNDVKKYMVNAYDAGLEHSYDYFISRGFFTCDFFRKDNSSRDNSRKRLTRIRALPNTFTDDQKAELLRKFNGKCAFTGKDVPIQIDHVIPVASGHGGTVLENMLPIWQRINSSKGDRNVFEWYEKNGERFEVVPELFEQAIGYIAELNGMTYEEYREYVYDCHNAKVTQTN